MELCGWLNNPAADGMLADMDPFYGFRYVNGGLFHERLGFAGCSGTLSSAHSRRKTKSPVARTTGPL
jgi:hypothetical protein